MSRDHDDAREKPTLEQIERVFHALAHESRRSLLLLLSRSGELPSGYLAARFQHSWPTTCRHLEVLVEAELIHARQEGRSTFYRLDRPHLMRVVRGWLRLAEPIGPEKKWTSTGPKTTRQLKHRRKKGERR